MDLRRGIDLTVNALLNQRQAAYAAKHEHQAQTKTAGGITGRKRGLGMDLYELRAFVDGDDIRHIDASATARTGRPHIKTFVEENDRSALLIADFRKSMFWGTRHALRAYLAALCVAELGWQIADASKRFSLLIVLDDKLHQLGPLNGEAGMLRLCEELCHFYQIAMNAPVATPLCLEAALHFARDATQPGSYICVATGLDDLGAAFDVAMRAMHRREIAFKIMRDPIETAPAKAALPIKTASSTTKWVRFSPKRSNPALRLLEAHQADYHFVTSESYQI